MFRSMLVAAALFFAPAAVACGGYMPATIVEIEDASFQVWMTEIERAEKVGELYLIAGREWTGAPLSYRLMTAEGELVQSWSDAWPELQS